MATRAEYIHKLRAKALVGRMPIVEALKSGKTPAQVARERGISEQRIGQIKKWAKAEGLL